VNYGDLALLYDRLMSHVGYHRWHNLIEQVIKRHARSSRPSILEIGAGTGLLGERLRVSGFQYLASDLSYPMCRQARARLGGVVCADGRYLPFRATSCFDLVLFLYDGINYLKDRDSYVRLFGEVHARLSPGGLFLFDVTTVFNSVNNFTEYVDADDFGDCFYFRHSYYHSPEGMQYNDFTIFRRCDESGRIGATFSPAEAQTQNAAGPVHKNDCELYTKSLEHHEQKVFPVGVIRDFVPDAQFEILGIWDDFSFKKHTARSERVHFLLRKRVPA
jgi:SAM-dependent methyltransferase